MANSKLDKLVGRARAELAGLMLSTDSGSVTIHCSKTNQLRYESRTVGEDEQPTPEEIAMLRQTVARQSKPA